MVSVQVRLLRRMGEELGSAISKACRSECRTSRSAAQVTSLALCKHNKNDLLLVKLRRHVRHGRARSMFWRYNKVPKEALAVLEVRVTCRKRMCI